MLVLSKIGWLLVQPISLILIVLVLAFVLVLAGWRRRAAVLLALGAMFLALSAFTSFGYVLIAPLEATFFRPAQMPARVDGIIVLGGGMDADVNQVRDGHELNRSGDRFTEALRLALLYPTAKIVITGGSGVFPTGTDTEADAGARFFLDFGIARERLILEDAARNTEENAQLTKALVNPQAGQVWLLVTSAFHMPRSVGLFRAASFDVVPWPTDYFGAGNDSFALKIEQPAENLSVTTIALREWLGLFVSWITGRTDAPVPAP